MSFQSINRLGSSQNVYFRFKRLLNKGFKDGESSPLFKVFHQTFSATLIKRDLYQLFHDIPFSSLSIGKAFDAAINAVLDIDKTYQKSMISVLCQSLCVDPVKSNSILTLEPPGFSIDSVRINPENISGQQQGAQLHPCVDKRNSQKTGPVVQNKAKVDNNALSSNLKHKAEKKRSVPPTATPNNSSRAATATLQRQSQRATLKARRRQSVTKGTSQFKTEASVLDNGLRTVNTKQIADKQQLSDNLLSKPNMERGQAIAANEVCVHTHATTRTEFPFKEERSELHSDSELSDSEYDQESMSEKLLERIARESRRKDPLCVEIIPFSSPIWQLTPCQMSYAQRSELDALVQKVTIDGFQHSLPFCVRYLTKQYVLSKLKGTYHPADFELSDSQEEESIEFSG